MKGRIRRYLLPAFLAFVAALLGVGLGRTIFPPEPAPGFDLSALLRSEIRLDEQQKARIAAIDRQYRARRTALETQMRGDNARLAEAIAAEHGDGARVNAAVDRCHQTMGELQKVTLAHVFAIRRILRPDQAAAFDRAVTRALTADVR